MSMSAYLAGLRSRIGNDLLVVPSATAIIRDEHGRLLLARHADRNLWVVPGGAIDPWESPADAAVRETWEEVGLTVEPVRVFGVYGGPEFGITYSNGDRANYVMIAFECRLLGGEPRPDGDETAEVAWVSEEDAASLPMPEWVRTVFRDTGAEGAWFRRPGWRPPEQDPVNEDRT